MVYHAYYSAHKKEIGREREREKERERDEKKIYMRKRKDLHCLLIGEREEIK